MEAALEPAGVPGAVVALQTYGSVGAHLHPHKHVLVTDGVRTRDGRFHPVIWSEEAKLEERFVRRLVEMPCVRTACVSRRDRPWLRHRERDTLRSYLESPMSRSLPALAVLLLLAGGGLFADEDEDAARKDREERSRVARKEAKESLAIYTGTVKFVGDERLVAAAAKRVIEHSPSFAKVYLGEGDDTPRSRLAAHLEKTGRFEPSLVLGMPEIKEWAKGKGLNAEAWFRRSLRAELLLARARMLDGLEEFQTEVGGWGDLAMEQENEAYEWMARHMRFLLTLREKQIALVPPPTEEEKTVLEKHGKALEGVLGESVLPGR